jgi:hypothetical protein
MMVVLIGWNIGTLEARRREYIQRSVVEKTNSALEGHFKTLAGQRTQLAEDEWSEVVRNFVLDHVRPLLSREERAFFHRNFAAVALAVERAIKAVDSDARGPTSSRSEVEAVA